MATVKTWGERLFYEEEIHGRKGLQPKEQSLKFKRSKSGSGGEAKTASYYRERLNALVDKHPQVNVKITGGNKSLGGFAAHVNYINHNGTEELENENGEIFHGRLSAEELQELWGGDLSTSETGEGKYRENFHIVFSMPPDTNRDKFSIAARETVHELFAHNYRFLMAEHRNTEHPHLHVVVKAVGEDGKRLNPKKADLRQWREIFAKNLRRHGIKAEATSRQIRGKFEKSLKRAIYQMKKDNRTPDTERDFGARIKQDVYQRKPYNHSKAVQKAKNTRAVVRGMYNAMIKDLERSEFDEDKQLATRLRKFVDDMPRINPREKVVYEEHREQLDKAKALQAQLAKQKQGQGRAGQQAAQQGEQETVQKPKINKPKL